MVDTTEALRAAEIEIAALKSERSALQRRLLNGRQSDAKYSEGSKLKEEATAQAKRVAAELAKYSERALKAEQLARKIKTQLAHERERAEKAFKIVEEYLGPDICGPNDFWRERIESAIAAYRAEGK